MKIEIEKSEYDRLKSREEKYLAYMDMLSYRGEDETYVDALCGKVAELEEENETLRDTNGDLQRWLKQAEDMFKFQQEKNKKLREENEILRCSKGGTPEKVGHEEFIQYLMKENKKLKEENEILEEYKLMYEGLCN